MKTSITGMGMIVVIALTTMINLNILNFTSRSSELNIAVNNAIVDTQRVLFDKSYPINNMDEYVSEFAQNLMQYINSNSDISIKIYGADERIGLLDVGVVSSYKGPTGKEKSYEVRRTSIVDILENENFNEDSLKDCYYVTFSVINDIKIDLSNVNFLIPKEIGNTVMDIPLNSGTISRVDFGGETKGIYSTVIKDGQSYLRVELRDMKSSVLVKIQ